MKKATILTLPILAMVIILVGCSSSKVDSNPNVEQENDGTSSRIDANVDEGLENNNAYTNEKYNFTMQYPKGWDVVEDENFLGPIFKPKNLSMEDLATGAIDGECAFAVNILPGVNEEKMQTLCQDNVGNKNIGGLDYMQCGQVDVSTNKKITVYRTLQPNTENMFDFTYSGSAACQQTLEDSLKTLIFN